jgi:cell division protein FtsN
MAKIEPGVYEPSSDDIRVFDGGEDDMDEEGSRLPLLIVIALLVLAAFGGVVWLAYSEGLQKGRESAPQVIAADRGPVRTAPENPGGATPYQGLKIYEQPAPSKSESTPATSAPATSTPPAPSTHAKTTARTHAPSTPPSAPHTAAVKTPKPAAPKPATTKPAPVKTASTAGGYVLQIGAYKSEAEAKTAWKTYQRKHPLVGGYTSNIKRVDLGAKGVWYRLRIGSFADRGAAGALCTKLKADGGGCFPARN